MILCSSNNFTDLYLSSLFVVSQALRLRVEDRTLYYNEIENGNRMEWNGLLLKSVNSMRELSHWRP